MLSYISKTGQVRYQNKRNRCLFYKILSGTYSPTVIAAAITSQTNKAKLPTHIALSAPDYGLPRDSVVLLEQIRTLDKRRLRERMGRVDGELMERIDAAIAVSFGLQNTQLV